MVSDIGRSRVKLGVNSDAGRSHLLGDGLGGEAFFVALEAEECGAVGGDVGGELGDEHGHSHRLFERSNHSLLQGDAADEDDASLERFPPSGDEFQLREAASGERVVGAANDVGNRLAFGDVVDDLGLGEDGADAADRLRIVGLERDRADFAEGDFEIPGDAFQKSARARRAFFVRAKRFDFAPLANSRRRVSHWAPMSTTY